VRESNPASFVSGAYFPNAMRMVVESGTDATRGKINARRAGTMDGIYSRIERSSPSIPPVECRLD
jgi:hypothetical protein